MNISNLRALLSKFPDEVSSVQFAEIEAEIEDLLAQQRQADEAELAQIEQRAAKLREKLGVKVIAQPPGIRPAPTPRIMGDTDADNGVAYSEESEGMSLRDETAALRARSVERRRARGH